MDKAALSINASLTNERKTLYGLNIAEAQRVAVEESSYDV